MLQEKFSRLVLSGTSELRDSLAISGQGAIQVSMHLCQMGLESWFIKLRKGGGTLGKLFKRCSRHVGLVLVGIQHGEFEIVAVVGEIWFKLNHFPVSGGSLVIVTGYIKNVATSIERIGLVRANRLIPVIVCQGAVQVTRRGQLVAFKIQQIFALRI